MEKILLALVALCATMSMNAQVIEIYKNGELYESLVNDKNNTFKVIFKKIPVTSVTLNKTTTSIYVGDYETITATIAPEGAIKTVSWSSDNTDVSTVDADGKISIKSALRSRILSKS